MSVKFLYGIDFALDQATAPNNFIEYSYSPYNSDGNNPSQPIGDKLANLPPQPRRTIRVFLEHGLKNDFDTFLKQRFGAIGFENNKIHVSSSLVDILAQCNGGYGSNPYWGFNMTTFDPLIGKNEFNLAVEYSPEQRLWKDADGNVTLSIRCHLSFRRGSLRFVLDWNRNHRIDCLKEFVRTVENMEQQYKFVTEQAPSDVGDQDLIILFILRIFHSQILMQCRAFEIFQTEYNRHLDQIASNGSATGTAVFTTTFLRQIASVANNADRQHSEVKALYLAVEALLNLLSHSFRDCLAFRKFDTSLRAVASNLSIRTGDLVSRMDTRLRFLETSRNIQESTSLWLLSLLAAIFLPLSLASSLLSMQTRLVDLHYLLYDFFGVIVLFGSAALVIILVMKRVAKANGSAHGVLKIQGLNKIAAVLAWATVVSSFLVGMIVNVNLGLKTLGISVAADVVILTLCTLFRWYINNNEIYWDNGNIFMWSLYVLDTWLD